MMFNTHLISALLGILLAPGTSLGVPSPDPLMEMSRSLVVGCEYTCRECTGGHEIIKSVDNDADANHLETCNPEGCESHRCDNFALTFTGEPVSQGIPLGEIWWAVEHADAAEFLSVVEQYEGVATYNRERQAIQVMGCNGVLIASIPIPAYKAALADG